MHLERWQSANIILVLLRSVTAQFPLTAMHLLCILGACEELLEGAKLNHKHEFYICYLQKYGVCDSVQVFSEFIPVPIQL